MVKPRVKQTKLCGLRPHEKNPRGITAARLEELKASLVAEEQFGRVLHKLPFGQASFDRLSRREASVAPTWPSTLVSTSPSCEWVPSTARKGSSSSTLW